jgi:hypothetical protein
MQTANGGLTWGLMADHTNAQATCATYNATRKAFFAVAGGIYRLDYDWTLDVKMHNEKQHAPLAGLSSFKVSGRQFALPKNAGANLLRVSAYSQSGKLVSRQNAKAGETILLPAAGDAVMLVKVDRL